MSCNPKRIILPTRQAGTDFPALDRRDPRRLAALRALPGVTEDDLNVLYVQTEYPTLTAWRDALLDSLPANWDQQALWLDRATRTADEHGDSPSINTLLKECAAFDLTPYQAALTQGTNPRELAFAPTPSLNWQRLGEIYNRFVASGVENVMRFAGVPEPEFMPLVWDMHDRGFMQALNIQDWDKPFPQADTARGQVLMVAAAYLQLGPAFGEAWLQEIPDDQIDMSVDSQNWMTPREALRRHLAGQVRPEWGWTPANMPRLHRLNKLLTTVFDPTTGQRHPQLKP